MAAAEEVWEEAAAAHVDASEEGALTTIAAANRAVIDRGDDDAPPADLIDSTAMLELSHCRLRQIDLTKAPHTPMLINLTRLRLDNNSITVMENLAPLVHLTWLDLSFNQIERISVRRPSLTYPSIDYIQIGNTNKHKNAHTHRGWSRSRGSQTSRSTTIGSMTCGDWRPLAARACSTCRLGAITSTSQRRPPSCASSQTGSPRSRPWSCMVKAPRTRLRHLTRRRPQLGRQ